MTLIVVPVSGGKDSQLTLAEAVDKYGRKDVVGVFHPTGFDHPLTEEHLDYIRDRYGVAIEITSNPKYANMRELLDKKNIIPGRTSRFCTDEFKIKAFSIWLDAKMAQGINAEDMLVLMGMRAAESQQRRSNYGDLSPDDTFSLRDLNPKKILKRHAPVRVQLPIVDRSTPAIYETLRKRGDKINPLYARGHSRVGCYPCILAGQKDFVLAARDPVGRENVIMLRDFKALISEVHKDKLTPEIMIPHDIDALLERADKDPFGFFTPDEDDTAGGCQWCIG